MVINGDGGCGRQQLIHVDSQSVQVGCLGLRVSGRLLLRVPFLVLLLGDGVSEVTCGVTSQPAVAMTAVMTLKTRVRQIRGDLERLREAQLDWCHGVQRDIDQALNNIKVNWNKKAVLSQR